MSKLQKYNKFITFEDAYLYINDLIITEYEYITDSRTGNSYEIMNMSVDIMDGSSFKFCNPLINRIDYNYAETFFQFMMSGRTDAESAFEAYPEVAQFVKKPKNSSLPENFNAFYGPRIASQLSSLIKELKDNPNTRRATVCILSEKDQILLTEPDNKLEYPCTVSATFNIRDGVLNLHTHMRSQNTAIVMQLDFYLMGRLLEEVARLIGIPVGKFSSNITNAHIFERDLAYVMNILYSE